MKEAVAWHALIPRPITGPEEALAVVNELGFCMRGPVPHLTFPYLALRHGGDGDVGLGPHLAGGKMICILRSGLNWRTMKQQWPDIQAALAHFSSNAVAESQEPEIEALVIHPAFDHPGGKRHGSPTSTPTA